MAIITSESYKSLLETIEEPKNCPLALFNLSYVLERTIQKNDNLFVSRREKDPITIFHGVKAPPNLSITQYMERILKYSRCSPCCFVMAQIYMDRYFQKNGGYLTSFNAHRLLITSVMVAAKFVDNDEYCSNGYYAQVGGVSREEMNIMELEFLFSIEFTLFVTEQVFMKYCEMLDKIGSG